ncbi:MAG: hypothetical protein HND47_24990 [Chloroflexi bacterium]|nr:hypothetical protein [Chloroflexota bacterium]
MPVFRRTKGEAFRELVAEERVNEVDRPACTRPADLHGKPAQGRNKYPNTIDGQKKRQPMSAYPLKGIRYFRGIQGGC